MFDCSLNLNFHILTFILYTNPNLTKNKFTMTRNANDKWLGGVLGGIARSLGTSSGLLRGLFLVFFFGVGGLTFGISSGATLVIYLIFWFTLGKS